MKNIDRGIPFYLGYLNAVELIKWASSELKDTKFKDIFNSPKNKRNAILAQFLPTTSVFGNKNISEAYLNAKRKTFEEIGLIKKEELQPKEVYSGDFKQNKIPASYYKFKYKKSHLFSFDGERI
jgi:hypothetical protein